MIRYAVLFSLMVLLFCATLIGAAIMGGTLTQEDLDALFGETPTEAAPDLPQVDELNATARLLRDREKLLDEREAELNAEAERIEQEMVELQTLLNELEQRQDDIEAAILKDEQRRARDWTEIADSLSSMEAQVAADTLSAMMKEDPETVPHLIREIDKRSRGKILSNVDPEMNKDLFLLLQQPAY